MLLLTRSEVSEIIGIWRRRRSADVGAVVATAGTWCWRKEVKDLCSHLEHYYSCVERSAAASELIT